MHTIAVVVESNTRFTRIEQALKGRVSLRRCLDWAAVRMAVSRAHVSALLIEAPAGRPLDFEEMRSLRGEAPRLGIILWAQADTPKSSLFDAGRLGIDSVIVPGENDTVDGLQRIVERLMARSAAALLQPHVSALPKIARDATLVSVIRAHEDLPPQRLAESVGLGRRALANHLADAGLPSPHQLLTWGRLIVAGSLLESPTRTADSVANDLGFASPSGFRNLCKRYLGATPAEIRTNGGAVWVTAKLFDPNRPDRLTPGDGEGDDLDE